MPKSEPILSLHGVTVRRGDTTILDHLDWTLHPGEHWVILGSNGSGKTSLLSSLTGYLTPSEGSIRLLGEEFGAADWRELRQRVGLVSSSIRQLMHDEDSALEIVAGGARAEIGYWGAVPPPLAKIAKRALKQAEAENIAQRPWGVLSQGERQRVLIARSLMAKPKLLILDEPCAGLDPVAREHFLDFVERLIQAPKAPAVVLVTHHVEEITPAFTHGLLLRAGRVLQSGPLAAVMTAKSLSATFGARLRLTKRGGRWAISL